MRSLFKLSRSKLLLTGASVAALFTSGTLHAQQLSGLKSALGVPGASQASGTGGGTPAVTPGGLSYTPALAQQKTQQSSAALSTAVATLKTQLATQAQANTAALAASSSVPNGMGTGGLVVDPRVTNGSDPNLWVNAAAPTQTTDANGNTTVTITQTDQRAVLTWDSFNIGKNTTVYFDQSKGNNGANGNSWVALNRIDATSTPSQIAGRIKAEGTVLIINPNGVIFTGSSQINVHSLVASSLDINTNNASSVFFSGSANPNYVSNAGGFSTPVGEDTANQTFLQNGLFTSGGSVMFSPGKIGGQLAGGITVQKGAEITTDTDSNGDGGFVALLGTSVTNQGAITTTDGQIILAAGSGVALTEPASTATGTHVAMTVQNLLPTNSLPGNLGISLNGAFASLGGKGTVTNDTGAVLQSNDGNVSLLGDQINQLGSIGVTTSITRPGSISLSTAASSTTGGGNIVLGSQSTMAITPDEASGTTPNSVATPTAFTQNIQPNISITASGNVDMQSGALLVAPAAAVSIGANNTVLLETGSTIDLSGLADVVLPMSSNFVTFKVTANEVADTPEARNLIGQTVTIDTRLHGTRADGFQWVGSPLLDAAGWAGTVPETIGQLLTTGGALQLTGQNVVQAAGSTVNLSGGSVEYTGGMASTTKLLGSDGHIYDIGSANPNMTYVGVAGQDVAVHSRWAITETFVNPLMSQGTFQTGYISGANAGSLSVSAANPVLEGEEITTVVAGARQAAGLDAMPTGASLTLTLPSPNSYDIVLESQADAGADPFGLASLDITKSTQWQPNLAKDASNNFLFPIFSDLLTADAFQSISIKGANQLNMPADATLAVRPGGSITLDGVSAINGALVAHSGKISLTGFTYAINDPQTPPVPALVVGPHAVLDTSGLWVNDKGATQDTLIGSAFVNGGSVSITTLAASSGKNAGEGTFTDATQSIILSPGSVIDVSSGGYVGINGALKTGADGLPIGKGGSVALTTYSFGTRGQWSTPTTQGDQNQYNVAPHSPDGQNQPNQANVELGGSIFAGGFDGGGTFSLTAPTVVVDGNATGITSYLSQASASRTGMPAGAFTVSDALSGTVVVPTSLFQGGFSQYSLTSTYGGTMVTAGTQVVLKQSGFLASSDILGLATGSVLRDFARTGFAPDGLRKASSLTLQALGYAPINAQTATTPSGGLLLDAGASIVADPQATVSLIAGTQLTVLGDITAHGGTINLYDMDVVTDPQSPNRAALPSDLWIGTDARLDVSGAFVANPLVTTYATGSILDGGTINLISDTLIAEKGSQFLLKGASANIQMAPTSISRDIASLPVWSNGGTLQISSSTLGGATGDILFAGTVDASGGAPLASGGTLNVGNIAIPAGLTALSATLPTGTIVVEPDGQIGRLLPDAAAYPQTAAALTATLPATPKGFTFIGTDTINNSGFASATLDGNLIDFAGSVHISMPGSLTLISETGQFIALPSATTSLLPAGVVANGNTSTQGTFNPTTCGTGCIPTIGGTRVDIDAGYVRIVGSASSTASLPAPTLADGTLDVSAQWIDLERNISTANFGTVDLTSADAIRLLPNNYGYLQLSSTTTTGLTGLLVTPGNLNLAAAEVYPVTNTTFTLMSTGTLASDSTITFSQTGTATGPLSAGGGLNVYAKTIVQDGTLWAPLGHITLGLQAVNQAPPINGGQAVATQTVTLGNGSLTSVSADGLYIPDGATVDGSTSATPPAKTISLFGTNISIGDSATIDASGGGDIYATEYVPGTGGTRNVLTSVEPNLSGGTLTTQYPDGRQVYALVPASEAKVAAYDPTFAGAYYSGSPIPAGGSLSNISTVFGTIQPGMSVTIGAGAGIPAGTYVLLPGMYATLPGAYRVVQVAGNVNPNQAATVANADGSQYVTGYMSNNLTGARSSQASLFQIQSKDTWSKASDITITSDTQFFHDQAIANNTAALQLPIDGGQLIIGATGTLKLGRTNDFAGGTSDLAPGLTGASGQVAISANNILILASDKTASSQVTNSATPYLILDADQLSNLGVGSVLIGGTSVATTDGNQITPTASNIEVETDAAHALTGPELTLVTLAPATANASARGLVIDDGSIIAAKGTVAAGTDRDIVFGVAANAQTGQAAVSGDGAMLRVSNGGLVSVTRNSTGAGLGSLSIGNATISGAALTLDTSGNGALAAGAVLNASNYDIAGSVINVGGGTSGIVLSPATLQGFAGAQSVRLRSASVINFYDAGDLSIGDAAHPIDTLIFDAAGLYDQGGTTTVNATNIDLTDSQATANVANALSGTGGTLNIKAAKEAIFDAGDSKLGTFATVNVTAGQDIALFSAGATDAGSANINLTAPELLADAGSNQSITTTGNLSIVQGAGTAPAKDATNIGGGVTLTAGSITDTGTIEALAGKVALVATSGDVTLGDKASIDAAGSEINILDATEDAPAGSVRIVSQTGNVNLGVNTSVSVAAAHNGYAGSLTIGAAKTATLDGKLLGQAAYKDLGGSFALQADTLDASSVLPIGGFTGSFGLELGHGDITLAAGQAINADKVLLVADSGNVVVNGTIDASNPNGGTIGLYGAGGVSVGSTAQLKAAYAADDKADPAGGNGTAALMQQGGTITLGTTGQSDGTLNSTYGYQNVQSSGAINVASGAVLDVSGGPGGANINNNGGEIDLRAPLLANNTVNLAFNGTVKGTTTGNGVVLNAFAVWSTDDHSATGSQHFDGIIDPAGWFSDSGAALAGTDTVGTTTTNATAPTADNPLPTSAMFTVGTANADHTGFYQSDLVGFVETFNPTGTGLAGLANVHVRPEIDLINPDKTVNSGNITVASNWNLGAGTFDANSGQVNLFYRTTNGAEPGKVALLAANNVNINATITDGFFTNYTLPVATPDALSQYNAETASAIYQAYLGLFDGNGVLQYDSTGIKNSASVTGFTWAGASTLLSDQGPSAGFFNLTTAAYNALNLQFTLKHPDVITATDPSMQAMVTDQYNQYYAQYVKMFDAYATEITALDLNGVNPKGTITPVLPLVSGGVILSYADYVSYMTAKHGTLLENPVTGTAVNAGVAIPAAPTTASQYYNFTNGLVFTDSAFGIASTTATDYASKWAAYFNNVVNLNLRDSHTTLVNIEQLLKTTKPTLAQIVGLDFSQGVFAAIAATPPAPPPDYLSPQAGYLAPSNAPHPADQIADNAALFASSTGTANVFDPTSSSPLMSAAVSGKGSFSYAFVAGAAFSASGAIAVDPDSVLSQSALSSTLTGDVTVNGHTAYTDPDSTTRTVTVPTLVRTGTGSIDIAAAGDVEFLDKVRPGAIYTAGAATTTPSDFTAPAITTASTNGLVGTPVWGTNGGAVTVNAGGSITGVEMPKDTDGSQTGATGNATGQMWAEWYYRSGISNGSATPFSAGNQTAAWINYNTFFQGFGALGGGDISLTAGQNIVDIGASLPETLVVGGGKTLADPAHITYYGGGNLAVQAGGDLISSDFLVGRGTGRIQAGGAITVDPTVTVPSQVLSSSASGAIPLPLLLAVQDGFVTVQAQGDLNLGNIFDPAGVPTVDAEILTSYSKLPGGNTADAFGELFTTFGPNSGVSLLSVSGDVDALTLSASNNGSLALFTRNSNGISPKKIAQLLPATLDIASLTGDIAFNDVGSQNGLGNATLVSTPTQTGSDTGTLTMAASGSINLGQGIGMAEVATGANQVIGNFNIVNYGSYISPLGTPLSNLLMASHANDPDPVLILAGQDVTAAASSVTFIKPATIEAGNNFMGKGAFGTFGTLSFFGQNNNADDVTSITAGNNLIGGSYTINGPGAFLMAAGGNMGPFTPSVQNFSTSTIGGIITRGNINGALPYLPTKGADTYMLFGIKPGIDYKTAIADYVDPAEAGGDGIDLLAFVATRLGQSRDAAWTTFQGLDSGGQQRLVDQAFLEFLTQVATDYRNPQSPYFNQYGRAYAAISTLFPASLGYTDNAGNGGASGAAKRIVTGNLNIASSVLESAAGGDINIIGPGGGITVGSNAQDVFKPNQEGILTLAGGTIRTFTDGSVILNQSRVMTTQGGDIDMFTANGDISAGEGPKTYVSAPPISELCDFDGFCHVNPQGLVTGAGIAALVTLPGQDPTKSNATLVAPHGTIDAGAAGVRVAGDLNLIALQVLNAFNIDVGGKSFGLPPVPTTNLSLAVSDSSAATANQLQQVLTEQKKKKKRGIVTVEVLGFGDTVEEVKCDPHDTSKECKASK